MQTDILILCLLTAIRGLDRKRNNSNHEKLQVTKTVEGVKNTFIVPTDARYYKIIEMLKQFKIITLAPTCFGSRRSHHQGAVLCLAKTTKWFFCARRYRRSQCYGGISACCAMCVSWNNKSVFDTIDARCKHEDS